MTTRPDSLPMSFDRRLTEDEKSLICWLAVRTVSSQTGGDDQAAADALDRLIEMDRIELLTTPTDAYVVACGNVIVHAARDWLAFHAMWAEQD